MMYEPERYLSVALLNEVVSSFDWPAPFTIEDELPDGIVMRFPNASLMFTEGFESAMDLVFLSVDTGTETHLGLTHALLALVPENMRDPGVPLTPGLLKDDPPAASRRKVENGLHDLCTIALHHLRPVILGDFSWVAKYQALTSAKRQE